MYNIYVKFTNSINETYLQCNSYTWTKEWFTFVQLGTTININLCNVLVISIEEIA